MIVMSSGQSWLFRCATVIAAPILCLALLEGALRLADYGYPAGFFVPIPGARAYTTNQKYSWRFFPPEIARTPVPYRLAASKPPDSFRIFVLGESAAMGFPEPGFSFGRMLQAMLHDRYPGVNFEVINAAVTAINSHVVLPISRDCAAQSPDLFIVYMGNNEVVGPYGSGSVFGGYSPSLSWIRAAIWLKSTRTGQLLAAAGGLLSRREGEPKRWKGMAMFLDHLVAADDPRMPVVYANFRRNLADIFAVARGAGAKVIVSTAATNLTDSPPFASVHRRDLSEAEKASWEESYREGLTLAERGDCAPAVEAFGAAAKLDDRFADLHFRLGQCLLALQRPHEARRHFALARDLDALRFRADTEINNIIRWEAAGKESQGVYLVDSDRALDGVPSQELFYEHVHPTFNGNYRLARLIFERLASVLPARIRKLAPDSVAPPVERVANDLVRTGWDEYRMLADISALMEEPPFTNQLDYAPKRMERQRRLRELRNQYMSRDSLEQARARYVQGIGRAPEDLDLHDRFADLLAQCGDLAAAERERRELIEKVPNVAPWHTALGKVLTRQGHLDEALAQFEQAIRLDRGSADTQLGLGNALQKQGKLEEAVGYYLEALRRNPNYAEAENNLGLIRMKLGAPAEALKHYSEALRINPDFAEAHNNLGLTLASLGQLEAAIGHFFKAVEIQPDLAGARSNLAEALVQRGRTSEAVAAYTEALRSNPDSFEAHYGLAGVLALAGKLPEATEHYSEAVRLKPGFAEAHYNLGILSSRQGKVDEAIAHYAEALRIRPDYAEALNNMGTALARQGKMEGAIVYFTRALQARPGFVDARSNLQAALSARGNAGDPARP